MFEIKIAFNMGSSVRRVCVFCVYVCMCAECINHKTNATISTQTQTHKHTYTGHIAIETSLGDRQVEIENKFHTLLPTSSYYTPPPPPPLERNGSNELRTKTQTERQTDNTGTCEFHLYYERNV